MKGGSKHKLRDGRPAARSRTDQWSQATEEYTGGTLFCFWFVLARTPVANVELFPLQTPFSGFELGSKLLLVGNSPILGSRAVVPLSESFQISFALPNPPARGLLQLAFHATCLHRCCGGDRLGLLARRRVASLARTNSLQAHRISCWSPWWGAGPLSGALLGDGAS